jgi:uncharacterized DUF497 family protein
MIEFDEEKSEKNYRERGFDFTYAARIFDDLVITTDSTRGDEQRFKSTGIIDGKFYTVIYTWRKGRRRIISARRARRQEIEDYGL